MSRALIAMVFLGGCSALVDPDPSLLGNPEPPMECSTDCSDGVECTVDRCDGTVCVNERDNTRCAASERCDMLQGCIDASCTTNENCDDGLGCNGVELCNDGRCAEGAPVVCDDGVECTVERCDEATGACASTMNDALCDDGVPCTADSCSATGCVNEPMDALCDDGFCFQGAECTAEGCQGGTARDCGDGNECTTDSCDPAASMCVNEIVDTDEDTFSPVAGCSDVVDCDDTNPDIYPGAVEICDDIDQDCDGDITDGCGSMLPDTCDTAQLLASPGGAPISVSGSFDAYAPNYRQRCSEFGGRDIVFALNLEPGFDYVIDTLGSAADTILGVTNECGNWNFAGRGCNDDIVFNENRQSRLFLRGLSSAPGLSQVFILLEQYSDEEGSDWVLNVRRVAASGLMCDNQVDISLGGAVVGYIAPTAPTLGSSSCVDRSLLKREHYFRVATADDTTVRARTWSDDFDHAVSRHRNCFSGASDCDGASAGERAEISWRPMRESDVILVDGSDDPNGDFYTLQFEP